MSSADQTLVIDDNGSIKSVSDLRDLMQHENDVTEWLPPGIDNEGDTKNTGAINLSANAWEKICSSSDDELSGRQRGDFSLYSFYLKSSAKWLWVVWLFTVIFVSLGERLPGEWILCIIECSVN